MQGEEIFTAEGTESAEREEEIFRRDNRMKQDQKTGL
jgi:hypothetical protein